MRRITEMRLREIEQRAEKATPGPWKVESSTEGDWVLDNRDDVIAGTFVQEGDADFIAHARSDVLMLVNALREAYEDIDQRIALAKKVQSKWNRLKGEIIDERS